MFFFLPAASGSLRTSAGSKAFFGRLSVQDKIESLVYNRDNILC